MLSKIETVTGVPLGFLGHWQTLAEAARIIDSGTAQINSSLISVPHPGAKPINLQPQLPDLFLKAPTMGKHQSYPFID